MEKETLIRNVLALRAQMDAAQAQLDALLLILGVMPPEAESGCRHPPEFRQNLTCMGGPETWQCKACGHMHTGA